jgi:hypothetical protein
MTAGMCTRPFDRGLPRTAWPVGQAPHFPFTSNVLGHPTSIDCGHNDIASRGANVVSKEMAPDARDELDWLFADCRHGCATQPDYVVSAFCLAFHA